MNDLTHTLGVLVGGPGFDEVKQESKLKAVRAAAKIISVEFYRIGRDEFRRRYQYNKRFAVLAALTIVHVSALGATSGVLVSEMIQSGLPLPEHLFTFSSLAALWLALITFEGTVFKYIQRKYPSGAARSRLGGHEAAPTTVEGPVTLNPDISRDQPLIGQQAQPEDYVSWLLKQPKAQELVQLAERSFQGPEDLQKMADARRQAYDKAWGATHSETEDFQPLTR